MIQFTLFGIPISIRPSLWIALALIGSAYTDPRTGEGLFHLALFVIAGFVTLLIHELGHALVGRKLAGGEHIISMQMLGGQTQSLHARFTKWTRIATVFAGPGATILLYILVSALIYVLAGSINANLVSFFIFLLFIQTLSFWWTIFNLLPILPLDGGQIMAELVKSPKKAYTVSYFLALVVAGLTYFYFGSMFLPIFMCLFAYINYQAAKNSPY